MLAVFVTLLVGQLERNSQHVIALILPLILLLRTELSWIQTCNRSGLLSHFIIILHKLKHAHGRTNDTLMFINCQLKVYFALLLGCWEIRHGYISILVCLSCQQAVKQES